MSQVPVTLFELDLILFGNLFTSQETDASLSPSKTARSKSLPSSSHPGDAAPSQDILRPQEVNTFTFESVDFNILYFWII